jgi:hypothetical protein
MVAEVHILHPHSPPIGGFLRVGQTGHRKLEAAHAAGRFPYRRLVFDASHIAEQHELLRLRDALVDLQTTKDAASRSRTPVFRGGAPSINAALGQ